MADTGIKISGLTEATSAADADVVAGVQSGTTKKFPLSVLFNYIKGKLTASDIGAQAKITASGILKGDGSGGVSAAVAGTDFQAPLTAGTDYATPAALSATQQISALPLADPATANIAAGKYVVYNNLLYLTNAAISSGETAASFASKIDAVPDGGLNALKSAFNNVWGKQSITLQSGTVTDIESSFTSAANLSVFTGVSKSGSGLAWYGFKVSSSTEARAIAFRSTSSEMYVTILTRSSSGTWSAVALV